MWSWIGSSLYMSKGGTSSGRCPSSISTTSFRAAAIAVAAWAGVRPGGGNGPRTIGLELAIKSWTITKPLLPTVAYIAMSIFSLHLFRLIQGQRRPAPVIAAETLSPEEKYKKIAKQRFLDIYSKSLFGLRYNSNIDPIFYLRPQYQEAIALENNALEMVWKSRFLMETTPRGNIIMFYNAYKRGFAYYSDQTMPYELLNAVAMKYVVMFRCLHFFLDEQVVPKDHPSPFVQMYEVEDAKPSTSSVTGSGGIDVSKGPFAKFKSGASAKNTTQVPLKRTNAGIGAVSGSGTGRALGQAGAVSKDPVPLYFKNRFINLGKISNCNLLQSVSVNKRQISGQSNAGKGSGSVQSGEAKPSLTSYGDYKFWRTMSAEPMT